MNPRTRPSGARAKFYESWDAAEPGKGYDTKAAEWRAKLPQPAHVPDEPGS